MKKPTETKLEYLLKGLGNLGLSVAKFKDDGSIDFQVSQKITGLSKASAQIGNLSDDTHRAPVGLTGLSKTHTEFNFGQFMEMIASKPIDSLASKRQGVRYSDGMDLNNSGGVYYKDGTAHVIQYYVEDQGKKVALDSTMALDKFKELMTSLSGLSPKGVANDVLNTVTGFVGSLTQGQRDRNEEKNQAVDALIDSLANISPSAALSRLLEQAASTNNKDEAKLAEAAIYKIRGLANNVAQLGLVAKFASRANFRDLSVGEKQGILDKQVASLKDINPVQERERFIYVQHQILTWARNEGVSDEKVRAAFEAAKVAQLSVGIAAAAIPERKKSILSSILPNIKSEKKSGVFKMSKDVTERLDNAEAALRTFINLITCNKKYLNGADFENIIASTPEQQEKLIKAWIRHLSPTANNTDKIGRFEQIMREFDFKPKEDGKLPDSMTDEMRKNISIANEQLKVLFKDMQVDFSLKQR